MKPEENSSETKDAYNEATQKRVCKNLGPATYIFSRERTATWQQLMDTDK